MVLNKNKYGYDTTVNNTTAANYNDNLHVTMSTNGNMYDSAAHRMK